MSAFKERRLLEEVEFNYHLAGPRLPVQESEEDETETEIDEEA